MLWDVERRLKVYGGVFLLVLALAFSGFVSQLGRASWVCVSSLIIGLFILLSLVVLGGVFKVFKDKGGFKKYSLSGVVLGMILILIGTLLMFLVELILVYNFGQSVGMMNIIGVILGVLLFILSFLVMFG